MASGSIVAKREMIEVITDTWLRRLFVDVQFQPADSLAWETIAIAVDTATYDQLHVGMPVRIRYAPNPTLRMIGNLVSARLEQQWPLASFGALVGSFLAGILVFIGLWLILLAAWSKWRRGWLAFALIGLMVGGVIFVGSGWPLPMPPGPLLPGRATVTDIWHITEVWGSHESPAEAAVQPYDIVTLAFVPQGMTDLVVTADMVDAGSVPGLGRGETIPIQYSARNPRRVQISEASRTYYWKNLRSFALIALLILGLFGGTWLFNRRRLHRRKPNQPGDYFDAGRFAKQKG
jgi:hypothetical protein